MQESDSSSHPLTVSRIHVGNHHPYDCSGSCAGEQEHEPPCQASIELWVGGLQRECLLVPHQPPVGDFDMPHPSLLDKFYSRNLSRKDSTFAFFSHSLFSLGSWCQFQFLPLTRVLFRNMTFMPASGDKSSQSLPQDEIIGGTPWKGRYASMLECHLLPPFVISYIWMSVLFGTSTSGHFMMDGKVAKEDTLHVHRCTRLLTLWHFLLFDQQHWVLSVLLFDAFRSDLVLEKVAVKTTRWALQGKQVG